MTDREIFVHNLNRLLEEQGKRQKDLAEYVGAKTTTVSGWTRGVSYPRADSMEKIANFFGIKTSQLVGEEIEPLPKNDDVRLLIKGLNKLSPEQLEQAKNVMRAMFTQYADYFKENDDDPEL